MDSGLSLGPYGRSNISPKFGEGVILAFLWTIISRKWIEISKILGDIVDIKIEDQQLWFLTFLVDLHISNGFWDIFQKNVFQKSLAGAHVFQEPPDFGQNTLEVFDITGHREPPLPSTIGSIFFFRNKEEEVNFDCFEPLYKKTVIDSKTRLASKLLQILRPTFPYFIFFLTVFWHILKNGFSKSLGGATSSRQVLTAFKMH